VVAVVRQTTQLNDNLQSPTLNLTAEQVRKLDEASAILFDFPHDFYRAR
jgi:aryl-alcohol dehydrogenase-like predicted oxidoreductase